MKKLPSDSASFQKTSVLFFEKIGPSGISVKKLEALFKYLNQRGFHSLLPSELDTSSLTKSFLLVFTNGYRSFFTQVYPLLKKHGLKAAVGLPVGLIGQYDAWQPADEGAWQDLLTKEDLIQLKKDKNIAFISQGLDNGSSSKLDEKKAIWQLEESKFRLHNLYSISTETLLFTKDFLQKPAVLSKAQQEYNLLLAKSKSGRISSPSHAFLRIISVSNKTWLWPLFYKMKS